MKVGERKLSICMVVWNEFLHDARVTKEAESLIAHGGEVSVVAVHNPSRNLVKETLSNGILVLRVSRAAPAFLRFLIGLPRRIINGFTDLLGRKGASFPDEEVDGPRINYSSMRPLSSRIGSFVGRLFGYLRMAKTAYMVRADAYVAHDANVLLVTWLVAALRRKPLIYDAHEISADREGYRAISSIIFWTERMLAPRASLMLTTSGARADHFANTYSVKRPLVIQNRPRLSMVARNDYLREYFSIEFGRPIVLYQGGIQRGRGLHNIVRVANKLRNYAFVFVGQGAQLEEICAFADELGLAGTVYFHPVVPLQDLPKVTASADVGLQVLRNTCLNHYTTDSNKLFEYIMAGLPVVASDFPEIRSIVQTHGVGCLVDPENIDAIADSIVAMLSDRDRYQKYRQACELARTKLSWETQENAYVTAVAAVLRGG